MQHVGRETEGIAIVVSSIFQAHLFVFELTGKGLFGENGNQQIYS